MEKLFANKKLVVVFALACAIIWGVCYSCTKVGYSLFNIVKTDDFTDEASKMLFAGARFVLAGIISLGLSFIINKKFPAFPVKKTGGVLLYAFFQTFLQYAAMYIALSYIDASKSSILNQLGVFLLILLSHFLYKSDRFGVLKIVGCVIGFAGIIVVNLKGLNFSGVSFQGEGLIIVSSFSATIGYVICKKMGSTGDPIGLTGWQQLIGGAGLLIVGLLCGGRLTVTGAGSILMLIFLAVAISVAYVVWSMLLKYNEMSKVAVYKLAVPVFGVLAGWAIGGENIWTNPMLFVSMAMVSAGILLVNMSGSKISEKAKIIKIEKQTENSEGEKINEN